MEDKDNHHEDPADKYSAQYNEESYQIKQLLELIIGPTHEHPDNTISVKLTKGNTVKIDSFELLAYMLKALHTKILTVTWTGVGFGKDFVRLINEVDNVLWTGMVRIANCNFTGLSQNEIMDVFRYTVKPASLSFTQNPGLSSDILNKAITEGIFGCSLAFIGDESDGIRLKPEALLRFLHRRSCPHTLLTIHPAFVEDGITKFIEAILKKFKSDTEPVSFYLQLTTNVILPMLADAPFKNAVTGEYLSIGELEVTSGNEVIKKTIIRRSMDEKSDNYSSHHEL
ncbi:hypothetical protein Ddc_17258 [Ditylenchus destructor]|nr:hypothetical protein Ddc_17258 [Ditylenchus destructor]